MLLHLDRPADAYVLRGADGTSARVNERVLAASFVIAPDRLDEAWPVRDARLLDPTAIEALLAWEPEVLVLGTGASQVFPPAAARAACLARGVGLEVMANAAAARTFTVLASEGRRVVAGFILPGHASGAP